MRTAIGWLSSLLLLGACLASHAGVQEDANSFPDDLRQKIKYVIILFPENRSFDSLYGSFPGANGLKQASLESKTQLLPTGQPYESLPQPNTNGIPGVSTGPDSRFNGLKLANEPFDLQPFIPNTDREGDLVHRFYVEQYQINNKKDRFKDDPRNAGGAPMSKFAAWSDNPGLVMSHYDASRLEEGSLARQYVLCDNTFHSAFGGSFLNHFWLISARSPVWPANPSEGSPPRAKPTQLDCNGFPMPNGQIKDDSILTDDPNLPGFATSNFQQKLGPGDYWCVNTALPLRGPAGGLKVINSTPPLPAENKPAEQPTFNAPIEARLPLQYFDTIGDRLSAANISWAWYSEGWDEAKSGNANYLFQFHHQPFAFFAKYALAKSPIPAQCGKPAIPGIDSPGSAEHLKDANNDFFPALCCGEIPRVCFVKPIGQNNAHPGYASVKAGEDWVKRTVARIQESPIWNDCAIFIIYDEHGGQWDHVTPPVIDPWGPGTRIPFTVISPYTKHAFVDHTQYETVSLLNFIEHLLRLSPLNQRDARALPPVSPFMGQPDLVLCGTVNRDLNYQLPGFNQPSGFRVAGELDGLTWDSKTGVIKGVPLKQGSYSGIVTVQSSDCPLTYSYRLDVKSD